VMKGNGLPVPGVGVEVASELGNGAGGLVGEGESRAVGSPTRQAGRESVQVLGGLGLHAAKRVPLGLGLDEPMGRPSA
jgi:hypothetical protein